MAKPGPKARPPTDKEAAIVAEMASYGFPQEWIARILKMSDKTLRKKYRDVLDTAEIKLKCDIARWAVESARLGDTTMRIFLAKVRLGWKERAVTELEPGEGMEGFEVVVRTKGA